MRHYNLKKATFYPCLMLTETNKNFHHFLLSREKLKENSFHDSFTRIPLRRHGHEETYRL